MTTDRTTAGLLCLDGKVALVTGGAGGIGSAVVGSLLSAGARVASVDLPGARHAEGAHAFECDLGDGSAIPALFDSFETQFERLDVLIHCAGIARDAVLWKMDGNDWSEVLRANLDSAFFVLKEAAPRMRRQGKGAVVLVSSINGERGKFGQSNYAASKAGLIGLGRTAARELGRFGIRVNIIAPGLIDTPMTASLSDAARQQAVSEVVLGSVGRPEDVARAVLFMVSAMSEHITGQVLRVDGGQLMA